MLLRRIEKHLRRSGVSATRFGREAAGDPRLVFDLRDGREMGPNLRKRLRAYLDQQERRGEEHPCNR